MSSNASSHVVLCATTRLARSLQMTHQRQEILNKANQWQTPQIYTLSDWLNHTIETAILLGEIDAASVPTNVLTAMQEGLLWEQSIQQSLKTHIAADLFDTSGLASAAMEANRLVVEWRLNVDITQATEETQQFMQWQADFQHRCKANNMLEAARFEDWQITCLARDAGQLPSHIQLAGFDRIHPHTKRLITVLETRGVTVSTYNLTLPTVQDCYHVNLADQDAECRAAVAWTAQELAQKSNTKLAIVVPELETLRPKLSALLDDIFHPEAISPAHAEIQRCYDFTLGVPLSSLPIISTAIDLLRFAWQKQAILQNDISKLIHSVYWSDTIEERDARAQLDARMRQDCSLSLSSHRFIRFLDHACEGEHALSLPALLADTKALMGVAQKNSRLARPSQWAETFSEALEHTHWQGKRSISSHEYQAVESFKKVLQDFANLAPLMGNISANEALKRLAQLCKNQIFQAERKTLPSIQVMGMLEACAEPLDGLWVMGMNDHVWPPIARHNALLPADIQRYAKTPNASSEVQADFALAIHQRLIKSATRVIFSSAMKDGERELRISPLMQGLTKLSYTPKLSLTLAESLAEASRHDWQWLADHQAPPVKSGEHVSGGTGLLKAQAICPAWAFYQYRLNARKLDEPANGLDVMERGSLVHAVLAKYWDGRSQEQWQETIPDILKSELLSISETVLATFNIERNHAFSARFLSLEAARLSKLVFAWLIEVEMLRPQGFNVIACEQSHDIDIEGIRIKLVIDRIDLLDDQRLVVIDYKTGHQLDYKNWAQANITEPQLPIYAAFVLQETGHEIGAVCYAKVRTADNAFIGVAAASELIQGATVFDDLRGRKVFDEATFPHWQSIVKHWKSSISATAISLKNGDAAVKFDNESQLAFCDVTPLLRLPEWQLQFERQYTKDKT
ncbi:MAG: PD-(D/E)XK nuclease family protein [Methylophilaceae bacterium]